MAARWLFGFACGALLLVCAVHSGTAKPPDLPLECRDECKEIETDPHIGLVPLESGYGSVIITVDLKETVPPTVERIPVMPAGPLDMQGYPLRPDNEPIIEPIEAERIYQRIAGPVFINEGEMQWAVPASALTPQVECIPIMPCGPLAAPISIEPVIAEPVEIESENIAIEPVGVEPVEVEAIDGMPEEVGSENACEMPVPQSPCDVTCPYLKEKNAQREQPADADAGLANSVLENLDKLKKARRYFKRAERLYQRGKYDQAASCFERVRQLCPGTCMDAAADLYLKEMTTRKAAESGEDVGETQEVPDGDEPNDQSRLPAPPVEAQVAEILEACQRAFTAGCYDEARALAQRALMLDPDSVAAHALVHRTHLLTQLRQGCPGKSGCSAYQPCPPPVDPSLVDGMEEVQAAVEKPVRRRTVEIIVEESGDEETAEEASEPDSEVDLPTWHIEVNGGVQLVGCDEESEPSTGCEASSGSMLGDFFRGLCEAMGQGCCMDVDVGNTERAWFRCSWKLGSIFSDITCDTTDPHLLLGWNYEGLPDNWFGFEVAEDGLFIYFPQMKKAPRSLCDEKAEEGDSEACEPEEDPDD